MRILLLAAVLSAVSSPVRADVSGQCAEIDRELPSVSERSGLPPMRSTLLFKRQGLNCPGNPPAFVAVKPAGPTAAEKAAEAAKKEAAAKRKATREAACHKLDEQLLDVALKGTQRSQIEMQRYQLQCGAAPKAKPTP